MAAPAAERLAALASLVESALPGWRIATGAATPPTAESFAPSPSPSAFIAADKWTPPRAGIGMAGGAQEWTIALAPGEAPERSARLAQLEAACEALRRGLSAAVLAGLHGPLEPAGSESRAGLRAPWALLRFREHLPPPLARPPAFSVDCTLAAVLDAPLAAGSRTIPAPFPTITYPLGDAIAVSTPDDARSEFLGVVASHKSNGATMTKGPSQSFPAGSRVWRLADPLLLPVCGSPGLDASLDARTSDERLSPTPPDARRGRLLEAGPMRLGDALAAMDRLAAMEPVVPLLLGGCDGRFEAVALSGRARLERLGNGLARLSVPMVGLGDPFDPSPLPRLASAESPSVLSMEALTLWAVNGGASAIAKGAALVWTGFGAVATAPGIASLAGPYAGIARAAADPGAPVEVVVAGLAEGFTPIALAAGDPVVWIATGLVKAGPAGKAHIGVATHATAGAGTEPVLVQVQPRFNP